MTEPAPLESGEPAAHELPPKAIYNAVDVAHIAALLIGQKPDISTKGAAEWAIDLLKQSAAVLEYRPDNSARVSFEDAICEITGTKRDRVGRAEEYFERLVLGRPSDFFDVQFSGRRMIQLNAQEGSIRQLVAYATNEDVEMVIAKRRESGFTQAEVAHLKTVFTEAHITRTRNRKKVS